MEEKDSFNILELQELTEGLELLVEKINNNNNNSDNIEIEL
jgi:hypothetical protein